MATTIFGPAGLTTKMMIPRGSASWGLEDIVSKGDYDNVLLLSFAVADQEIVDVRQCFDETTHIFAFGRNAGASVMEISFLVFLYDGCRKSKYKWAKLSEIREKYNKARVYKRQKTVEVTVDDLTLNGFLTRMAIGDVNPNSKTCVVNFTLIVDQEA